jgi:hypothetical protein
MSAPAARIGGRLVDVHPSAVTCECGHRIYDGVVIRSRCIDPRKGTALCRCKRWVRVPIELSPPG